METHDQSAPQPPQRFVTQAEYARRIGVHKSTITRQVQSGLIPTHQGLIDPLEADEARKQNLDQAKRRFRFVPRALPSSPDVWNEAPSAVGTAPAPPAGLLDAVPPAAETPAAEVASLPAVGPADGSLKAAQVKERTAKAALAEIELAKLRGELISTKEVAAAWGTLVITARNRLLLLVEEIEDATIRAKVMRKLEIILTDLSRGAAVEQSAA